MKNSLLRFLCLAIPVKKHPIGEEKRILIVTTTGLGDTLWATPAIESLRQSFPRSHIAALTSPIGYDLLKTNPRLDEVFSLKEPVLPKVLGLWKTLYRRKYSTVLIFHASQRLIFPLCSCIGATEVIGTLGESKGLDSLLTKALKRKHEHEILRRLKLVKEIGGTILSEKLSFFPENRPCPFPRGKYVIFHVGSKDGFKRWPAKNFISLGNALKQKCGLEIIVTGSKVEKPLIDQVVAKIPESKAYIIPSVHDFAAVLKSTKLLISNDTGPVHLACALKCPVIALYGPTDPKLCGPHTAENAHIFSVAPTCTPCIKRKCKEPFCLRQIGAHQVLEKAISVIEKELD